MVFFDGHICRITRANIRSEIIAHRPLVRGFLEFVYSDIFLAHDIFHRDAKRLCDRESVVPVFDIELLVPVSDNEHRKRIDPSIFSHGCFKMFHLENLSV